MSRAVVDGTGVKRSLAGWNRDRPHFGDPRYSVPLSAASVQPPKADLYPLASEVPVYDQGGIGSCTANMGCFMYRYLEAHAGRPIVDMSRMSLYKFVRQIEGTPLSEDSGAQIRNIMVALRKYGVAPESEDPYVDDGHAFTVEPTPEELAAASIHKALFFYRMLDLFTIKASILQGFPVGFGFSCYAGLMSEHAAQTGLVPFPAEGEDAQGGHAVACVAYNDDLVIGGEVGAIRFRNSWSRNWGDSGDGWMSYRYITSGLATDLWTLRSAAL